MTKSRVALRSSSFILPSTNALVAQLMGPAPEGAAFPVGLVLDTSLEVPGAPPAPGASSALGALSATRLGQRLEGLADTMVNGMDLTVSDSAAQHVCRLPANGYRATEFDMSQARAEALVGGATAVMSRYLDAARASRQWSSKLISRRCRLRPFHHEANAGDVILAVVDRDGRLSWSRIHGCSSAPMVTARSVYVPPPIRARSSNRPSAPVVSSPESDSAHPVQSAWT